MPVPIKFAVWNLEWLNDLFVADSAGGAAFKDDDVEVRGPEVNGRKTTVGRRKELIRKGLAELDVDVLVVVEGPNRTEELALLFSELAEGTWLTHVQRSVSPTGPASGRTWTSTQCVGIALRTDRDAFAATPLTIFDTEDAASGLIFEASRPFFYDTGRDKIPEWYAFERKPLCVELRPAEGRPFRVVGLHLKSKGLFGAYEWSRWWALADANRERLVAQCQHFREAFLDIYLSAPETAAIPLVVCGDINDGPGFDTSEMRLKASGIETLMGNVWRPDLTMGNALFDTLDTGDQKKLDFESLSTTRFPDPIFNDSFHHVWIDHVLYSRVGTPWVSGATILREMADQTPFHRVSDHYPVRVVITPPA